MSTDRWRIVVPPGKQVEVTEGRYRGEQGRAALFEHHSPYQMVRVVLDEPIPLSELVPLQGNTVYLPSNTIRVLSDLELLAEAAS